MVALLAFASFAVDLGYMHMTRARLNAMSKAGAVAGFERLKDFGFNYPGNQAAVDATIRDHLERNGATAAESAAAIITVGRRGKVSVQVSREVPYFFASMIGLTQTGVGGAGTLAVNNLAPFAIPTTYQDQDRDGVPNWNGADEKVDMGVPPWNYAQGKPYIVKYGKSDGLGFVNNFIFIPMDDKEHFVGLPSGSQFYLPPQDDGSRYNVSWLRSMSGKNYEYRESHWYQASKIGLIRAYGLAYDVLGLGGLVDTPVNWVLGYDGGSFLVSEQALLGDPTDPLDFEYRPEGGVWSTINGTEYTPNLQKRMASGTWRDTAITAVRLRVKAFVPPPNDPRPNDVAFVNVLSKLNRDQKISILEIDYQPKIGTFTDNQDPVTQAMFNAGIPFTAFFWEGQTGNYHSKGGVEKFVNPVTQTVGDMMAFFAAENLDWLHLHHEDFISPLTGSGGLFEKVPFVRAMERFVTEEQKFMFAACWASEQIDVALAYMNTNAAGAWMWGGGNDPGNLLYDRTFGFRDFLLTNDILGTTLVNHNYPDKWNKMTDISEIEGGQDHFWQERKFRLLDYLNPLSQDHTGFGDVELLEESGETGLIGSFDDSSPYLRSNKGNTDYFRWMGITGGGFHSSAVELLKNPRAATDGETIPQNLSGGEVILLGKQRDGGTDPKSLANKQLRVHYISGIKDNNNDLSDGFGRWSYMGGHNPPYASGVSSADYEYRDLCEGDIWNYGDDPRIRESIIGVDLNQDGDMTDNVHLIYLWQRPGSDKRYNRRCTASTGGGSCGEEGGCGGSCTHYEYFPQRVLYDTSSKNFTVMELDNPWGPPLHPINDNTHRREDPPDPGDGDCWTNGLRVVVNRRYRSIAGVRLYLNNILFGSTVGMGTAGNPIPNTGAINPAFLTQGNAAGGYGVSGYGRNNYETIFKMGSKGLGLPVGAQFQTAPGPFSAQTQDGLDQMMSSGGTPVSSTYAEFMTLTPAERASHPQVMSLAVVERIPPTAQPLGDTELGNDAILNQYMGAGMSNPDREYSMYGGDITLGPEDPANARDLHVVGFANFFIIDQGNVDPDTLNPADNANFVASQWRNGEVRGHFLGWDDFPPPQHTIDEHNPVADPR
jgi:hypothetical protein